VSTGLTLPLVSVLCRDCVHSADAIARRYYEYGNSSKNNTRMILIVISSLK
jgi:hypothetical protein